MKEDKIISALIGLVGACSNNPKTDNTDRLVIKALAFPLLCPEHDDKSLREIADSIHTEKFRGSRLRLVRSSMQKYIR